MELKISCGNVSQALAELKPGESLIVPCNGKTTQSGVPAEFGKNRTLRFSGHP